MKRSLFQLSAAALLTACTASQTAQTSNAVVAGQLFCAKATATGPLVVALANVAGVPVSVTNQTSALVAASCALIGAIPVVPPPNPGAAPVVATTTTLPAVTPAK